MKIDEIKEIIKMFDESSLESLKIESENFNIKLNKGGKVIESRSFDTQKLAPITPPAPTTQTPQITQIIESTPAQAPQVATTSPVSEPKSAANAEFITSPMVGTFYRSASPGAAPFVSVGDSVKKGQVIGIVEAMKIMNEIEAEFNCRIIEIEVNDAQPVEYGTKLVMVERI
ncbi:acetyl-CoA carboxylase biotin carboxyl carrier protein [Helicobacter saguini]|uniref:Biotin carboxyl carrier protein of acetyl-CoA carboxylase n=1 Tax=Helicobacter saguini TaxID=1548018 RepID=A0A347VTA8_9HELI|nr:acetyl-CoA carboxylase biotin carboxyl carrier protein [Helicobacter saguini]MWV62175.1 acetyl-CoA carboxylase biotin carboxyl carrier protein [Helicobacter saguini]MWV67152.1 acetyl-CoA carboxylase biotin carboxyl carrier protein [Helicobacter saguini]MWV69504.1 acetyl-CoA carboxylase biotin carboxyl carrier protein [Helicobacter saguini]MWV70945.1 acetyl-CoA carboxylase biotin carboxyl carrier protein [Helicobacter saguini]TLD92522.1 acetyl-CoA carboxylase biotin carboxyl carrier protein 